MELNQRKLLKIMKFLCDLTVTDNKKRENFIFSFISLRSRIVSFLFINIIIIYHYHLKLNVFFIFVSEFFFFSFCPCSIYCYAKKIFIFDTAHVVISPRLDQSHLSFTTFRSLYFHFESPLLASPSPILEMRVKFLKKKLS